MCVIAYAPPGVTIMDAVIEKIFKHNPDGAGIMWKPYDGCDVQIRKGFMDVESLKDAWSKVPTECEKAIHCRIATSGKISVDCCHPFPVREYAEQMRKGEDHAPIVLMHNGVFSFCEPDKGMDASYSDSMLFAARYLYPLRRELSNPALQQLLEATIGYSKLLIFNRDAKALLLGDWEKKDGVFFSNLNHEYEYSIWGKGSKGCCSIPYPYKDDNDDYDDYYYTLTIDTRDLIVKARSEFDKDGEDYTEEDVSFAVDDAVCNALDIDCAGFNYNNYDLYRGPTTDTAAGITTLSIWCYHKLTEKDLKESGLTILDMTEVNSFGCIIKSDGKDTDAE